MRKTGKDKIDKREKIGKVLGSPEEFSISTIFREINMGCVGIDGMLSLMR